jgi:lipopolysaccharide export LptBFGC system permease protein LptF
MLQKIKDNFTIIVLCLLVIVFFRQCGVNSEINKIKKENAIISANIDSMVTKEEMKKEMRQVMYEFLIYEDDFDKGKVSLSDLKNKIEDKNAK